MRTPELLEAFRARLEADQASRYAREFPKLTPPPVSLKPGRRWVNVTVGGSGKYMVDFDGTIYGIKGYGVPNRLHTYGTLDTIADFDWSDYTATRRNGGPDAH